MPLDPSLERMSNRLKEQRLRIGTQFLEQTFTDPAGVYLSKDGQWRKIHDLFNAYGLTESNLHILPSTRLEGLGDGRHCGLMTFAHPNGDSAGIFVFSTGKRAAVEYLEQMSLVSNITSMPVMPVVRPFDVGEYSFGIDLHNSYTLTWLWRNCIVEVAWAKERMEAFHTLRQSLQAILEGATVPDIGPYIPQAQPFASITTHLGTSVPLNPRLADGTSMRPEIFFARPFTSNAWYDENISRRGILVTIEQSEVTIKQSEEAGWWLITKNLNAYEAPKTWFKGDLDGLRFAYIDRQSLLGGELPVPLRIAG